MKEKLHSQIASSSNETLLEDLLLEAQSRMQTSHPYEAEGLSEDDYKELVTMAAEPAEKDTLSYDEIEIVIEQMV